MNKIAFNRKKILFIILIITAIILLLLGVYHLFDRNKYIKNGEKVYAKVVNILSYPDSGSDTYQADLKEYRELLDEYRELGIISETTGVAIIIEYQYQDKTYTKELGYFSNEIYISQNVGIYLNKNNPTDFIYEGSSQFAIYFCFIVGSVLLISNVLLLFVFKYNDDCNQILLIKGKCLLCEVLYADEDEKKSMFERHPYIFTCVYNDEENDEEKIFTSESVYCKNNGLTYIGKKIKVYVDPNDNTNYYVDTKNFEK